MTASAIVSPPGAPGNPPMCAQPTSSAKIESRSRRSTGRICWAIGAVGSALPSHGRGHRFESGIAHQKSPGKTEASFADHRLCVVGETVAIQTDCSPWCQGRRLARILASPPRTRAIVAKTIPTKGTGTAQSATIEYGLPAKIATAKSPTRMPRQPKANPSWYEDERLSIIPTCPPRGVY
jgi:hypothetical protein